jgi:EAL domain-containing protein (putative c-di-GMP-specific phosphodiesterase class I)
MGGSKLKFVSNKSHVAGGCELGTGLSINLSPTSYKPNSLANYLISTLSHQPIEYKHLVSRNP